jgi:hypothetical protein
MAESLYEAIAQAHAVLSAHDWVGDIGKRADHAHRYRQASQTDTPDLAANGSDAREQQPAQEPVRY